VGVGVGSSVGASVGAGVRKIGTHCSCPAQVRLAITKAAAHTASTTTMAHTTMTTISFRWLRIT
jgi:hypothetical protein